MSVAIGEAAVLQLPDDLLMEILSRLPVKSLLRFRSVCKCWCYLIQNPRFVALLHNRAKNKKNCSSNDHSSIILVVRSIRTENQKSYCYLDNKIVMSFLSNENPTPLMDMDIEVSSPSSQMFHAAYFSCVSVYGPCNGIVCMTYRDDIVLCNPSTREFKKLPLPPFSYPRDMLSRCRAVGFGFDVNANDYKVVRIVHIFDNDPKSRHGPPSSKVEIYNLSTDSWREVDAIVPISVNHLPFFEVLFNGAFHWSAVDLELEYIISFDITNEVIGLIQFPNVCSYPYGKTWSLSVLNESLALILYNPHSSEVEKYFDIWVMNEYGVKESWTKQFSIGPLLGIIWPLAFWNDAELLMQSSSGQLVSCNLHTQDIKEFQVHGLPNTLRVLLYTESITSIKRCNQLGRCNNSPI